MKTGKIAKMKSIHGDERGLITIDFIFALFLALGFFTVFFIVSVTLSLVEVGQYVTFSVSRAYMAAHESPEMQSQLAQSRFAEVMAKSAFKTLVGQQWMKLGPARTGDFSEGYPVTPDNNTFWGAQVDLDAKILHLKLPFFGTTAEDAGVGKATLNSYLMREVSTTECREEFTMQRYQNIKNLDGAYSGAPGGNAKLITDNGC